MATSLSVFGVYLFFALYAAGNMTTLQIQHYALYRFVGKDAFGLYMEANNRSALIPSVLPGLLLPISSIALLIIRPPFLSVVESAILVLLNLIGLYSTFRWQRRLQSEMAKTGFDQAKVRLLVSTNWIRTGAFLIQAVMATAIAVSAIRP